MADTNMAGMVVGFAAQDQGLESAFDRTADNLEALNGMLDDQSDIAKKSALPGMMKRLTQFSIGNMANQMQSLAGDSSRLTNNLESFGVQAATTIKPILANMGVYGKEAGKIASEISGIAYSANLDPGAITKSYEALHEASEGSKKALEEFDMTLKDHAKLEAVTGMQTEKLVGIVGDLTDSWGLSGKESKNLIDSMVAIGQESKMGSIGLTTMSENLEAIDVAFAKSQIPKTPEMIAEINKSILKLGGAFHEGLGVGPEEAMQQARGAFAAFSAEVATAEEAISKGLAPTYGDLTHMLAEVYGSEEKALAALKKGTEDPLALMTELNDKFSQVNEIDKVHFGRLQSSLAEIAPNMAFLVTNTDKGTAALEGMSKMTVKADGALKKLREGHSAGITLSEQLERAKESFETSVRSIARPGVRKYVRDQAEAYREVGKEWKEAAKEGGVFGTTLKYLSSFDQLGIQGIFSQIADDLGYDTTEAQKFGVKIGYAVDKVNQLAGEFQPLISMVSMLGPLGGIAAVGGVAAWFTLGDSDKKKLLGDMYEPIKGAMDKAKGLWDEWAPKVKKIFTEKIWPGVTAGWNTHVVPVLAKFWDEDFVPFLKEKVPIIGKALWDALKWAWQEVGKELGTGGQLAIGAAVLGTIGGGGLLSAGVETAFKMADMLGPKGVGGIALIGAAVAAGLVISNEWEKMTDEQWDLMDKMRGREGERTAGKGMESHDDKLKELTRQKNMLSELSNSGISTTDIGQTFSRTLFGEQTDRQLAMQNTMKQIKMLEQSIAGDNAAIDNQLANLASSSEEYKRIVSEEWTMDADQIRAGLESTQAAMGEALLVTGMQPTEAMSFEGGVDMTNELAAGIEANQSVVKDAWDETLNEGIKKQIEFHSPPEEGPLADGVTYNAGKDILSSIVEGMWEYQPTFKREFADVLLDAVTFAVNEFQLRAIDEIDSKTEFLNDKLKELMQTEVYKKFMAEISMKGGDADSMKATKQVSAAALSDSGMRGVKLAIVAQTQALGRVLNKIEKNTRPIAKKTERKAVQG